MLGQIYSNKLIHGITSMNAEAAKNIANMKNYKRIMLKMSGEVLMGDNEFGLHPETVKRVAEDIQEVVENGVAVCVVVGAVTSSVAYPAQPKAWTAQQRTIWVCWVS